MLINEFELEKEFDRQIDKVNIYDTDKVAYYKTAMFINHKPDNKSLKCDNFYWLQARNYIKIRGHKHLVLLMERKRKGIYNITPTFSLLIR